MAPPTDPTEPRPRAGVAADVVRNLEHELRAQIIRRRVWRLAVLLATLGGIVLFAWGQRQEPPTAPERFSMQELERRDIAELVESTGKLRPLTEVQVGAQVSGRVVKVHVDFNSRVEKGQLLAEIDPSLFGAQVQQVAAQLEAARASLARAQANVAASRTRYQRAERLKAENIATGAEVDEAKSALELAQADQRAAKAQIDALSAQRRSARTTLQYTKILSPIDGVVVNRAVDPGQTVAASFSAPVLFVIAQDLKQMQVLADIDEADVGKLKEQLPAEVAVDAFPGQTFTGSVSQIRYSPNEVQGVVTYSAVIDVDNPELLLRPGMTAQVSVVTRRSSQVLAVPNAALRFRPEAVRKEDQAKKAKGEEVRLNYGQGRVYTTKAEGEAEQPVARIIETGLSDGVWTEVRGGDLAAGQAVITSERRKKEQRKFLGLF